MIGRFHDFQEKKAAAALRAVMRPFATLEDRSPEFHLDAIGNGFTRELFDGPFFQSLAEERATPHFSLVFVQSHNGNTDAADPSTLGGGETDKHLIYEGLSRVCADAVMAGSRTVGDGSLVFSVWHPELVALRASLGKRRHPTQIVATRSGEIPIESALLFNAPEIGVIVLTAGRAASALTARTVSRPWITVVSSGEQADVRGHAERLRALGIERVSAVGGRALATELIDAGMVEDVYLTTSPTDGGTPGTPMYGGKLFPRSELVLRKRDPNGVTFEHFRLLNHRQNRGDPASPLNLQVQAPQRR